MYKLNLLNLGIPKSFPSTQIKQINHQDKDLFKGLRDAYWSDDEEDRDCPLCLEEMDISDLNFKPCPCGYQICRFCWHHIKENLNRKCPACRREYTNEGAKFQPVAAEDVKRIERQKKLKEKEKKELENLGRTRLADVRVIQRSLAYVVGWPQDFTDDLLPLLKSADYFGQYGRILKLSLSKRPPSSHSISDLPIVGIYILYQRPEDALKAISCIDGFPLTDSKSILRASYGTSKYCTNYLRNIMCSDPLCSFLHEPADVNDTFTKENLTTSSFPMNDGSGQVRRPLADTNPLPTPPPPQHYHQHYSNHFNYHQSHPNSHSHIHSQSHPQSHTYSHNPASSTLRKLQPNEVDAQSLPKSASWAKPGSGPPQTTSTSTLPGLSSAHFPTPSQSSHLSSLRRTPVSSNHSKPSRPQLQTQNSKENLQSTIRSAATNFTNSSIEKPTSRPSSTAPISQANSPDLVNLLPKPSPTGPPPGIGVPPPGLSKPPTATTQVATPPPPGLTSKPSTPILPPGLTNKVTNTPPNLLQQPQLPNKSRQDEIDDVLSLFKAGGNDFSFSLGDNISGSPVLQNNLTTPFNSQNILSSVSYLFGNDPSISYMSTYDHHQRKQVSQQREVNPPSVSNSFEQSPGPIYTGAFNPFDDNLSFNSIMTQPQNNLGNQFEQLSINNNFIPQPQQQPPPPPPGLQSFTQSLKNEEANIRRSSRFDFARADTLPQHQQINSFEDPINDLFFEGQATNQHVNSPPVNVLYDRNNNSPAITPRLINGPPPGIGGPLPGIGNNSPMQQQHSPYEMPFQDPAIMSMSSPSPHADFMYAQQQQQQSTPTPTFATHQPPPGFGTAATNHLNQLFSSIPQNEFKQHQPQQVPPPPGIPTQDDARAQLYSLLQGRVASGI